jgi:opacity protein-like surface antigen
MRCLPHAAALLVALSALAFARTAHAAQIHVHDPIDKLEVYAVRMDPLGPDASNFSRSGFGVGLEATLPLPRTYRLVAWTLGLEAVNLLSQSHDFRDEDTGLHMEQRTTQNYVRLFTGGEVGVHTSGFVRPYAGVHVAAVWYGIGQELVIPDDSNPENDVHQQLASSSHIAFGWDGAMGLDLNFHDRFSLDFGVRYLHSYGVPQQLGHGAVTIHPSNTQYRIGIGFGRRMLDS